MKSRLLVLSALLAFAGCQGAPPETTPEPKEEKPAERARGPLIFSIDQQDPVGEKHFYLTDLDMHPVACAFRHEKGSIRVIPRRDVPVVAHVLMDIPPVGRVMVSADNGGRGYTGEGQHSLNRAVADTAVRRMKERFKTLQDEGYRFSEKLTRRIEHLSGVTSRAGHIAGYAGQATEKMELEKARADVEKYGRSVVEVRLKSRVGGPVEGCTVKVEQTRREFLMGAHPLSEALKAMEESEEVRHTFAATFNLGIVPLDGQFHAPTDDPIDVEALWEKNQPLLAKHRELGLKPRGSICPFFTQRCAPWMSKLPFPKMLERLRSQVLATVGRFKDEIDVWLVVNEAHDWANSLNFNHRQMIEIARTVVDATHEADPGSRTIVNVCLPWGMYLQWFQNDKLWTPYTYFEDLNKAGVKYDIVGLQMYTGFAEIFPLRDLADMSRLLDRYAKLGKPIYITEICAPSEGNPFGTWHGVHWSLDNQARYAEGLITLAHGKPFVKAIRWFSTSDRQFAYGTGLVDRDFKPKPSYRKLVELAKRWTTSEKGKTDQEGLFQFRGYHGAYKLTVERDGERIAEHEFEVSGVDPKRVEVTVP